MKISNETIQILKSFSVINPSIQFKEGNILRTISPTKTIMAKAILPDNFEKEFAIYDLSRFLGVLSMMEEPQFVFSDNYVTINSGSSKVKYVYANPDNLVLPTKDVKLKDTDYFVSFNLTEKDFDRIIKAISVLGLPELVFEGIEGKIFLRATNTKNSSTDNFDIEVGTTEKEFTAVFKTENMKLFPADYTVSICERGISNFKNDKLEYFIAIESNSKF